MTIRIAFLSTFLAYFLANSSWGAPVLLESAVLGPTGIPAGQSLSASQLIGWRFQIEQSLLVDEVGGHLLVASGELFAALVRIDAIDAFPVGDPIDAHEAIAATTFTGPGRSAEVSVPLDAALLPGSYALVFGSGYFDATGSGAIPNLSEQTDVAPTTAQSYMSWGQSLPGLFEWRANFAGMMRFTVSGVEIVSPADFNLDDAVDGGDLAVWQSYYGTLDGATIPTGDANNDGATGGADLLIWQRSLSANLALRPIPEPTAAAVFALAAMAFVLRR